jgi:uncharacterized protein
VPEYLTPGVYFEFAGPAPAVAGVRTDIAGFVGLAERGPLDAPARLESWRQFQSLYGGFVPYAFLAYAVKGFFENGGRTCFVVRVAGATAARSSRVLKNASGDEVIRLEARDEGTWGDRVGFSLRAQGATKFSLVVNCGGMRESFPELSVDPNAPRYFARVVNEGDELTARSQWIRAEVVDGLPPGTDLLPDAASSGLDKGRGTLAGGADGVASLTRDDFICGGVAAGGMRKGLCALEDVDEVSVVCVPDIHVRPTLPPPAPPAQPAPPCDPCLPTKSSTPAFVNPPSASYEQPPEFKADDVEAVQRAMVEHCERMKDRFAILDAPLKAGGSPLDTAGIQEWRTRFDSARGFAALYYPWVKVVEPDGVRSGETRAVPPCGHLAGVYARTDLSAGVHKAPANAELFWASDVDTTVGEEAQGVLNPAGVNCIRAFPGRGIRVYGARTVSSDPDWRYVNVRRLMLMIEESVDEATQWAVFEPNDVRLRQTLVMGVSNFLENIWREGALTGATAGEAFFVRCDETNNPPESVASGRLVTDVGVAPARPAEFIVFRVGRTVQELEIVER